MTRHLHLDTVGGIAGDMFIACMLDAFPELLQPCLSDLEDCGVLNHVSVVLTSGKSLGLAVKRLEVKCIDEHARPTGTYKHIRVWLNDSQLATPVRLRAQEILRLLAEAESHVHGVSLDDVHFHEVADWDSIADIVAAASVIEHARIDQWSCSKLPLGSGVVDTEHGKIPVPAPATLHLMQGMQVWDDGEPGERVTPTGAAIVRHLLLSRVDCAVDFCKKATGTCDGVGVGAGQRHLHGRPNIVRCMLIQCAASLRQPSHGNDDDVLTDWHSVSDEIDEVRFSIDDMTPEELSVSLNCIRETNGVLDASFTVSMGKKERVVFDICVMCLPAFEASVSAVCFAQTSTVGMRVQRIWRRVLKRELYTVDDEHGTATIKRVNRVDHRTAKVESDDLQRLPTLAERRARAAGLLAIERA